ncbi:MAG: MCP four helix bundle domain-containing protein, partial [Hylemonella sp.]|nr:MCP four helix bundle domain-containing protein [Hylemonella sp.]
MKLRNQILYYGLASLLCTMLVGGIGMLSVQRLSASLDNSVDASHRLQDSQRIDMMHDAIRGDSNLALLGALSDNRTWVEEGSKGLATHIKIYQSAMAELEGFELSAETRGLLNEAKPKFEAYIGHAQAVIAAARRDREAARRAADVLQDSFVSLEPELAKISEVIEAHSEESVRHAQESASQVQLLIAVVAVLASLATVMSALWLARRMTRPMEHAVDVADLLAQ